MKFTVLWCIMKTGSLTKECIIIRKTFKKVLSLVLAAVVLTAGCTSLSGCGKNQKKTQKAYVPTLTDTSLYELQYQIPDDFDDVELHYPRFYSQITEELHDVIGMGVTYKHIGWQGELYTGVTFNAATKLEYHLATTGTPTDVKINGQPFKSYVPAGSARQMQYVTQFGNDVYEISFVYGDESTDAAFLNDVTFS